MHPEGLTRLGLRSRSGKEDLAHLGLPQIVAIAINLALFLFVFRARLRGCYEGAPEQARDSAAQGCSHGLPRCRRVRRRHASARSDRSRRDRWSNCDYVRRARSRPSRPPAHRDVLGRARFFAAHASSPHVAYALVAGVDLGPNLLPTASLSTILWLGALRQRGVRVSALEFARLGIVVVPPMLAATTLWLWAAR